MVSVKKQLQPLKPFNEIQLNKSSGILDDFAVRKNVATREGTIEKVPVNDSDIVNKAYCDINDPVHWHSTLTASDGSPSPALSVDTSGNVGIGTTSPTEKLDVVTTGTFGAGINTAMQLSAVDTGSFSPDDGVGLLFKFEDSSATPGYGKIAVVKEDHDTSSKMLFQTALAGTLSTQMVIDNSGNVGIGTTVPGNKLHIYNGASGGTPYATGILTIENSDSSLIQFLTPNNKNAGFIFGDPESNLIGQIGYSHSDNSLNFITNNAQSMKIVGGNVGIGTTSPDTKLQVVGDCKFGDDNTNYASFASDGELTLTGTAKVVKSKTFNFNYSKITAQGKPTLVTRGVFNGFSLPVYNSDDEELFTCDCIPKDWDGTTDPTFNIAGWLDTANTDKKFNLQVSVETYDPISNDIIPITTNDYPVETDTGTAAQYTSFYIPFTLDASAATLVAGQPIGIRIRRIAATSVEITGEFVIEGAVMKYTSNKLGEAT